MARILIIEDNLRQIEWAKKQFENSNHEVSFATSIMTAMQILCNGKFDAVLTDLELPFAKDAAKTDLFNWETMLFKEIRDLYLEGNMKGFAVVSNYEHHVKRAAKGYEADRKYNSNSTVAGLWALKGFGKTFGERDGMISFESKPRSENFVIYLDEGSFWDRDAILPDGTIKKAREVNKAEYHSMLEDEAVVVCKPWREIAEELLR